MEQILTVGFIGTLDTAWVEDWKMIKDKLTDGKNCKQVLEQIS